LKNFNIFYVIIFILFILNCIYPKNKYQELNLINLYDRNIKKTNQYIKQTKFSLDKNDIYYILTINNKNLNNIDYIYKYNITNDKKELVFDSIKYFDINKGNESICINNFFILNEKILFLDLSINTLFDENKESNMKYFYLKINLENNKYSIVKKDKEINVSILDKSNQSFFKRNQFIYNSTDFEYLVISKLENDTFFIDEYLLQNKKILKEISNIGSINFGRNDKEVIICCVDNKNNKKIILYNWIDDIIIKEFLVNDGYDNIMFTPDFRNIVLANSVKGIWILNTESNKIQEIFTKKRDYSTCANISIQDCSIDSKLLLFTDNERLYLYKIN